MPVAHDDFLLDEDFKVENIPGPEGGYGLIPRDPEKHAVGYSAVAPPAEIKLTPWHLFPEIIRDMEAQRSRISDIWNRGAGGGQRIKSLYQGNIGYCWVFGTVTATMALRAINNLPYVRLNPFPVGCKIKNYRNEGGWGALSLEYLVKHGCPSEAVWTPQLPKAMSRANDNANVWVDAAKYKVNAAWADMQSPAYNRDLSVQQIMTLLCNRTPVVGDFNWWSHCVALFDPVDIHPNLDPADPRRYGPRIMNSHGDSFGTGGMAVLADSKAWPNNAVAPIEVLAA